MSKELQNDNSPEEVDLGLMFNAIGKLFNSLIEFIKNIFKSIFSAVIFIIQTLLNNIKIITIVVLLSAIAGYLAERIKTKIYASDMLVETYFDAKYQLATNIKTYNALIRDGEYEKLSDIFNIDLESTKQLVKFEINPGPETENDRIVLYDKFVRSIDSVRAQEVSYEDYIENRDIFSGNLFLITVESFKKDIYRDLEVGLDSTFKTEYSTRRMEKRDKLLDVKKQNILKQLEQVDSLQQVYISVLEDESKSARTEINLGGESLSLNKERTNTREFELLNKEIELRNNLRKLEETKIEEDVFFDIISGFQDIGDPKNNLKEKYSLIFPVLSFALLCLFFMMLKIIKYVRNYR
ncbi:MAG: hypothetical protein KDD05_05715 [Psychroserpens sp.]|nr:hypothetical protein [Psychroserpens sp.]